MDTEQVMARIKSDQERGASIEVDRTPILFVDGVQIPFSSFNVEALHAVTRRGTRWTNPGASTSESTPAQPKIREAIRER